MLRFALTITLLFQISLLEAQIEFLQSGPMVGYSEMREVMLWVQTTESAEVKVVYWEQEKPMVRFHTLPKVTRLDEAFTAKLLADKVVPGKTYEYELWINEYKIELNYPTQFHSQALWKWREDAPDFNFVIGSCTYVNEKRYDRPGKPYGGDYHIFNSIDSLRPEMMLWLGDNIYLREADWNTQTGIFHRNTHTRSLPELQPLLARTHHYAIWDDHDFGPNDADGSFIHKDKTLKAFELFWANPTYGINGNKGITTRFTYNDCDFFLMDNRYYRTPQFNDTSIRQILGGEQLNWLIASLKTSRAPFKFVAIGGQVLNSEEVYENYARFAKERNELYRRIESENIKGVVFLSGDRHHGEVSRYQMNEELVLYEITSSPLTSSAHKKLKENNAYRVDGSLIKERHFTRMSISGKYRHRVLLVEYYSSEGKLLYTYKINQPKY